MAQCDPEFKQEGAAPESCAHAGPVRIQAGGLIDIAGVRHRIVAIVGIRILASTLHSSHFHLVQEDDGSLQLPTISSIQSMIDAGAAVHVPDPVVAPSPTARMRIQIDMLDAADVRQGDKAIWIHMAANWTPALEARFGPHDEPWKIRRWRAELRRTAKA